MQAKWGGGGGGENGNNIFEKEIVRKSERQTQISGNRRFSDYKICGGFGRSDLSKGELNIGSVII